jgi:hypothetical protein
MNPAWRPRTLTSANIRPTIEEYLDGIEAIGGSLAGRTGIALLRALKREAAGVKPYPGVSIFEAANRIMSDLVILHGINWLMSTRAMPFTAYEVELGNENRNGFDIRASRGAESLVGEAFNVAPSFFYTKKSSATRKLRELGSTATYRMLMFNSDARPAGYLPRVDPGLLLVLVDIDTGTARLLGW